MIFRPTYVKKSVIEITLQFLKDNKIKGLILDLDNTLTTHNNPKPAEKVSEWIEELTSAGVKMMIVSNNKAERVIPFAKELGLDYVPNGRKPLTYGFRRAKDLMGLSFSEIAIVGDQIFTDILGANLARVKTIYVHPIELEAGVFFRFKRFMEKPFIRKFK